MENGGLNPSTALTGRVRRRLAKGATLLTQLFHRALEISDTTLFLLTALLESYDSAIMIYELALMIYELAIMIYELAIMFFELTLLLLLYSHNWFK